VTPPLFPCEGALGESIVTHRVSASLGSGEIIATGLFWLTLTESVAYPLADLVLLAPWLC